MQVRIAEKPNLITF